MKKVAVSLCLLLSLVLVSSSLYAIGLPKLKDVAKASAATGNVKEKVNNIFTLSESSTQQYNNAVLTLNNLFSTKEEKAQLKAKQEALVKDANVSEKNAISGEVVEDASSNLENISKQEDLNSRISNLSADQKQMAGDCVWNIVLANLNMASVVTESADAVNELAANPTSAIGIDVSKLKTIATNAPKQVSSSAKTIAAAVKLLKSSKVKFNEPKTTTETAKEIPNFSFDEE